MVINYKAMLLYHCFNDICSRKFLTVRIMLGVFPSQKIAIMQLLTLRKLYTSLQDFNVGIFIDIFF